MSVSEFLTHNQWLEKQVLELGFDDIFSNTLNLTSHACESPFTQINLIGKLNHWRKTSAGLCIEGVDSTIELSELALHSNQLFEVVDVLDDKRLNNHEYTINGRIIRSYAAVPIVLADNSLLGCISIMDYEPRELNDNVKSLLLLLAENTASQVDLYITNNKLLKSHCSSGDAIECADNPTSLKEALERELNEFTYRVSHDLQSPLNAIRNVISWIKEDVEDGNAEDNLKHFSMVNNSVERMHRLLDDLRSYSAIKREVCPPDKVNLKALVFNIMENINEHNHYKVMIESDEIELPKNALIFVLTHLLSNAIKHHDKPKGLINVRCESKLDYYELSVTDDGPGIPFVYQNKIFDIFQKLKSKDEVEGSGLGLSMIRKTLVPYKAEVSVNSQVNVGTTFTIIWPKYHFEESCKLNSLNGRGA